MGYLSIAINTHSTPCVQKFGCLALLVILELGMCISNEVQSRAILTINIYPKILLVYPNSAP